MPRVCVQCSWRICVNFTLLWGVGFVFLDHFPQLFVLFVLALKLPGADRWHRLFYMACQTHVLTMPLVGSQLVDWRVSMVSQHPVRHCFPGGGASLIDGLPLAGDNWFLGLLWVELCPGGVLAHKAFFIQFEVIFTDFSRSHHLGIVERRVHPVSEFLQLFGAICWGSQLFLFYLVDGLSVALIGSELD